MLPHYQTNTDPSTATLFVLEKNDLLEMFVRNVALSRPNHGQLSGLRFYCFYSSKLRTPPWHRFLALAHSHLITRESL